MTTFLDKLNLRPQERRWVMGVMVVVIIVLNWVFVWPYFNDWSKVNAKMEKTRKDIATYQAEIEMDRNPTNGYKARLSKIEEHGGSLQLEGDMQLYKAIMEQANGKIMISDYRPVNTKSSETNFFVEQAMRIAVNGTEKELVDFIVSIGGDNSMIRVRELELHPADANRYRLAGTITLTANYQKKVETAAAKPALSKPALNTNPKPAPSK